MTTAHMTAGGTPVKLRGRDLASQLRDLPKKRRALLAAQAVAGGLKLTRAQAANLFGVCPDYIAVACTASAEERHDILNGGSLRAIIQGRKRHHMGDAALDRLVADIGPDKLLAALDRATAPHLTTAAY